MKECDEWCAANNGVWSGSNTKCYPRSMAKNNAPKRDTGCCSMANRRLFTTKGTKIEQHLQQLQHANDKEATQDIKQTTNTSCSCPPPSSGRRQLMDTQTMMDDDDLGTSPSSYQSPGADSLLYMGMIIGLISLFWLHDLFQLRSMLDTTTVEMTSSASHWYSSELWSNEWECFLNNDKEAEQVVYLLNKFTASYQTKALTYKQAMTKSASTDKNSQRVRRRSSTTSKELTINFTRMNKPPAPPMDLPGAPMSNGVDSIYQPPAPPMDLPGAPMSSGVDSIYQPPAPPMDLPGGPSANIEIRMDETTGKRYSVDLLTNESKWIDEGDKKPPAPLQIAVDQASGRRYSYNAVTEETKWIDSPNLKKN